MGRKLGKYSKLLFKLFLLIQLYCYHNLEVVAVLSRHENVETCNACNHKNGTHFDEETEKSLQRTKRPARMIPVQYMFKKEKNGTENQNIADKRFYGPASSCVEIAMLGYTRNGYYMVKAKDKTKDYQIEVKVLGCLLKHWNGSKQAKEETIGFLDIEIIELTKSVKRRSQEPISINTSFEAIEHIDDRPKRPARLLPLRMFLESPKNNTEIRFYGPASSCEELGKLGYTLNGLYLVDCIDKSRKNQIEVVECRFKQPKGSKEAKEERLGFVKIEAATESKTVRRRDLNALIETRTVEFENNQRIVQRPARLLPLQLLYGKDKNETEDNQPKVVVEPFYGPPNSCNELKKLGYTLNGYYLVKKISGGSTIRQTRQITTKSAMKRAVISGQIEISLCKFHQPLGASETMKEERYGLATTTTPKKPTLTSITGQPLSLIDQKQFIGNIGTKYIEIPLNHDSKSYYMLMNNHGRCLKPNYTYPEMVTQTICEPKNLYLWGKREPLESSSWNKKTFSVCAQYKLCISFKSAIRDIYLEKRNGKKEQDLDIVGGGNQLAQGDNCLAIQGDSDAIESKVVMAPCDPQQKGQIWSFVIPKLE